MLAHLAAFAALLPAAAAPVALAPVAAPTDVTVAWTSDHRGALVTWQEADDQADHITLSTLDGKPVEGFQWDLPVGHPNELFGNWPADQDRWPGSPPPEPSWSPWAQSSRWPAGAGGEPPDLGRLSTAAHAPPGGHQYLQTHDLNDGT